MRSFNKFNLPTIFKISLVALSIIFSIFKSLKKKNERINFEMLIHMTVMCAYSPCQREAFGTHEHGMAQKPGNVLFF